MKLKIISDVEKDTTPFAIIKGGENDGKMIAYYEEDPMESLFEGEQELEDPIDLLSNLGFFNTLKKKPKKTFEELRNFIVTKQGGISPETEILYTQALDVLRNRGGREIFIKDGLIELIPTLDENRREILYIAAGSGSGKTTFACYFLLKYQEIYKREVYIFTANVEDSTIKKCKNLKPTFIDLNKREEKDIRIPIILTNPFDRKDFTNSAVFFDDTDYINLPQDEVRNYPVADEKMLIAVKKSVNRIKGDLLGTGRHNCETVLVTSQLTTDYNKTRLTLGETDYIIIFPSSGIIRGEDYILKSYVGIRDPKILKRIQKELNSDWACIHVKRPQFVLYQHGCFLL